MIQVTENCTDITEAIKVVDIENNAGVVEDDFRDFGCDGGQRGGRYDAQHPFGTPR